MIDPNNRNLRKEMPRADKKLILQGASKIFEVYQRTELPKLKKELLEEFERLVALAGAYYEIREDGTVQYLGF